LLDEEVQHVYSFQLGHVSRVEKMRTTYKILFGIFEDAAMETWENMRG
jgi:hypothetical protein